MSDWVRIRITEMVPGMLEIGSNVIEALDLYQVHQDFMEKIEVSAIQLASLPGGNGVP